MKSEKQKKRDVVRKRSLRTIAKQRKMDAEHRRKEFNDMLIRAFPPRR